MSPILEERIAASSAVQTGSVESIAVVEELERRRKLVKDGKSRLISEDESWDMLRQSSISSHV